MQKVLNLRQSKNSLIAAILLFCSPTLIFMGAAAIPDTAFADSNITYNVGYASEYYTKGVFQKESSASAGVDYTNNGFYAGAWTADVGDGLEVDGYFGYSVENAAGFSTSLGVTTYQYTGDFDDEYNEINLNLGYKGVNLEVSPGRWSGFGDRHDYVYSAVTVDLPKGVYGKYGRFDKDLDGDHIEVGYNTSIHDLDLGIAVIHSSKEISDEGTIFHPEASEALIFTVSKTI